ncbi:hypothetical protein EC82524_0022B, partial [Escherichia coli 8.2524]
GITPRRCSYSDS